MLAYLSEQRGPLCSTGELGQEEASSFRTPEVLETIDTTDRLEWRTTHG
jgi:hypothetical protein